MSPHQKLWLVGAMFGLGVIVVVGIIVSRVVYRRLGYPSMPAWARSIRLADDLVTIEQKVQPALQNGFEVIRRDKEHLVLEKVVATPACTMQFSAVRAWRLRWQKFSVRCHGRPWLNWASSSGRNW
ncbi:MAG: hypothetical protein IT428_07305 [Planctomycetaceae bacterium]|nr:hypothetical protein [Planctomycetaceae bacterium]